MNSTAEAKYMEQKLLNCCQLKKQNCYIFFLLPLSLPKAQCYFLLEYHLKKKGLTPAAIAATSTIQKLRPPQLPTPFETKCALSYYCHGQSAPKSGAKQQRKRQYLKKQKKKIYSQFFLRYQTHSKNGIFVLRHGSGFSKYC